MSPPNNNGTDSKREAKHFVLIHGAGHGAWCWYKLVSLLEAASDGGRVTCLDLSAAGINLSNADSVNSFDEYNKPLIDFLSALPDGKKVILVGHSAGGMCLVHSLHEFWDKIEVAIFIAATMLPFGFATEDDIKMGLPDISEFGDERQYFNTPLVSGKPSENVSFTAEGQQKLLYQLSPIEDITLASMLLRPIPSLAMKTVKFEGKESCNFNKVRRVYIKTACDRMLRPRQQDAMIENWPPHQVFTLDTDHSPFFSDPIHLSQLIIKASDSSY